MRGFSGLGLVLELVREIVGKRLVCVSVIREPGASAHLRLHL